MAKWIGAILPTYVKSDGTVAQGYYVKTFENDGAYTTLKSVYKDAGKVTAHPNPFVVDASGFPTNTDVYVDGLVDVKIYDGDPSAGGNLVRSIRNVGDSWSAVGTDLNENIISNWSFEVDTDADGEPDNWTRTVGAGETAERVTAENYHGSASFKFISNNSESYLISDKYAVSPGQRMYIGAAVKASNASAAPYIQILWYDSAQAYISADIVWHSTEGTTPTDWTRIYGVSETVPATARYFEVKLYGNSDATSYTSYFDHITVTLKSIYEGMNPSQPIGLELSQAADADHDITVSAGVVLDDTMTYTMILRSAMTKRLDAAWAVGSTNGGMQSGSALGASTCYLCYLIANSQTGNVDIQWVPAGTAFSAPTDYDYKRYIGAWRTTSGSVLQDGIMRGNVMRWTQISAADVTDATVTANTFEIGTMAAPPYCVLHHNTRLESLTAAASELFIEVRPYNVTWIAGGKFGAGVESTTDDIDEVWAEGHVYLDDNRRLHYTAVATGHVDPLQMDIYTIGWTDLWRLYP